MYSKLNYQIRYNGWEYANYISHTPRILGPVFFTRCDLICAFFKNFFASVFSQLEEEKEESEISQTKLCASPIKMKYACHLHLD
jgi:hypothetical protein